MFADIWTDIVLPCMETVFSWQKRIWDAVGGVALIQLAAFSLITFLRFCVARFNGGWTWNDVQDNSDKIKLGK